MSELKTQRNDASVEAFLRTVESEKKRADCFEILNLMGEVTGEEPAMWGDSIVGFGSYHYKYASGREGEWFLTGFSPRAQNLTLYIMAGFDEYAPLLERLGTYRIGKSCLYIKDLEAVDRDVLRELVARSVEHMRRSHAGLV
ncbi:MAG: DUF1801 domain-containing protein [Anaerolineales bacterium]